ncbi:MAG: HEAT repeat domain-containing protein [Chthonomonadales bacterium]
MSLQNQDVDTWIERIRTGDEAAREAALADAPKLPATAVVPLARVMGGDDLGAGRAAQEGLRRLAYASMSNGTHAAVAAELLKVIGPDYPRAVRSDALMLLGCCGGGAAVPPISALLEDADIREDARMALERIPDPAAARALKAALKRVPQEYRPAIRQSLRHKSMRLSAAGRS